MVTFVVWLIRGREDRPQPVAELPGGTVRRKLTPPLIMFALIRALVMACTVALAFGLNLSHGTWLPIAAIVAMKPSLEQATLVSAQRLTGALIGAAAAALLLVPAVAIRCWNYALYSAAVAMGALILVDVGQPSDYAAEGYRVLWTFCGVGIALLVMLLASLLAKHTAEAPPRSA
ncbi:FUSC family protein [Streptomyces sp. NPDC058665]|uniref:FUSC family protein n=1 Tax=Streptomyces sp. NPDC058665 TaxID=3346586 RepID=UPI00364C34D0